MFINIYYFYKKRVFCRKKDVILYITEIKITSTFKVLPFERQKNNYPKIILSMDKTFIPDYDGIKHRYILDFLME